MPPDGLIKTIFNPAFGKTAQFFEKRTVGKIKSKFELQQRVIVTDFCQRGGHQARHVLEREWKGHTMPLQMQIIDQSGQPHFVELWRVAFDSQSSEVNQTGIEQLTHQAKPDWRPMPGAVPGYPAPNCWQKTDGADQRYR